MKKSSLLATFALAAGLALSAHAAPQSDDKPSPPDHTESLATKKSALLDYFSAVVGNRQLILGQTVNWSSTEMDEVEAVFSQTDKYPALLSVWANMHSSWGSMPGQSAPDALGWAAAGGIVEASMWPANPTNGQNATVTPVNFHNILVSGTPENANWHQTLDDVAVKLQALQDADVAVLFRPFIELNGNWFWWGAQNREDFIEVWQETHDYLVNTKGLQNLLFVYNVNMGSGSYTDYYPGDAYVDIVSFDGYTSTPAASMASTYAALTGLDKPLMLAEFGCDSPGGVAYHSCDYNALITEIHDSMPDIFAVSVWSQAWGLPVQKGATELLNEPWIVDRSSLPPGPQ